MCVDGHGAVQPKLVATERRWRTDLVLANVRGDHHENGAAVDEYDGDDVVERADVVLYALEVVVVAVSVAVVVAAAGAAERRLVGGLVVQRRHQAAVVRLLDAEREHAFRHRQTMSQTLRHLRQSPCVGHGRPHTAANGVSCPPLEKNG